MVVLIVAIYRHTHFPRVGILIVLLVLVLVLVLGVLLVLVVLENFMLKVY